MESPLLTPNSRSYLNRWLQPDSIIPDPNDPLDYDRYAYARNNPVLYKDPTGHWVETFFDIAFIVYDIYQGTTEGWTPVNTVALAADVACAILPVATGGGLATRGVMAGGEAAARAAVHVPGIIRIGQGVEKIFQFIDSGDEYDPFTSNDTSSSSPNLDNIFIPDDKAKQVVDRGWSLDSIKDVISNPAYKQSTTDNPSIYNWANGNPVTYYYRPDGHYVVIDNNTGQVVQVSNTFDPNWIDPMTNQEIQPIPSDN